MKKTIIGIQVGHRNEDAVQLQQVLTEYGCIIKTRLGLHQQAEYNEICTEKGLIILELIKDCEDKCDELEKKLSAISDLTVRKMEF